MLLISYVGAGGQRWGQLGATAIVYKEKLGYFPTQRAILSKIITEPQSELKANQVRRPAVNMHQV